MKNVERIKRIREFRRSNPRPIAPELPVAPVVTFSEAVQRLNKMLPLVIEAINASVRRIGLNYTKLREAGFTDAQARSLALTREGINDGNP